MASNGTTSCTECGRVMYQYEDRKAACEPRCLPCRKSNPRNIVRACIDCGSECRGVRCRECRAATATGPSMCTECGERMVGRSTTAAPRCHPCRAAARARDSKCPDCGGTKSVSSEVCRACRAKRQQIRADDDHRVVRHQRERSAPGIAPIERKRLLDKWKRQGVRCAYCLDALADTIDHAVPLVRGGTNYEGNLMPACRACNSSKGGCTIIEWRTGKRLPRMTKSPQWKRKTQPIKAIKGEQPAFNVCPECGSLCVNRYCNNTCNTRYVTRRNYRLKVGIPLDAPLYGSDAPQWARHWAA